MRNDLRRLIRPVSLFGAMILQANPVAIVSGSALAADSQNDARANSNTEGSYAMRLRDAYPLITTPHLFAARDFYARHFGFTPAFQSSWFVYLVGEADGESRGATLAFMHPDHPSSPPGPEVFSGAGMILTIEVADAAAAYESATASGAPIVHALTDETWGQRRFMLRDPTGMLVDVVQQIAAEPDFWEKYPVPE